MIIDFHVHVLPPEDMPAFTETGFHRNMGTVKTGKPPTTIENALEAAKIGGVDITVISNPIHNLRDMDRAQQLDRCRRQNRFNAAQQAKYPSIVGMASIVPYGGDPFLREFERAVKGDGLKGAWIMSSLQGSYPDDDDAMPFFQLATELDVPVVIHPPSSPGFGEERMPPVPARLQRRPPDGRRARHCGPDRARRVREIPDPLYRRHPARRRHRRNARPHGLRLPAARRRPISSGPYEPMLIKHPPSHYLKMMYLESTCSIIRRRRAVRSIPWGSIIFIFGTDFPRHCSSSKREGVDLINKIGADRR